MSYRGGSITALALVAALLAALSLVSPAAAGAAGTGAIKGEVKLSPGGTALPGAGVCAFDKAAAVETCVEAGAGGFYEVTGLPAGSYIVEFSQGTSGTDVVPQFFKKVSNEKEATPVAVAEGTTVPAIDAELELGGLIKGTVVEAAGGVQLKGVEACALLNGAFVECATTAADGGYRLEGLAAGTYEVEFFAPDLGYETQFYAGKTSLAEATPVPVAAGGEAAGINAAMVVGGSIAGHVYAASSRAPVGEILVCSIPVASGKPNFCGKTNAVGAYLLKGLSAGGYKIGFSLELSEFFPTSKAEPDGWPTQYWNLQSSLASADLITVPRSTAVAGIDALLGYVAPTPAPAGPVVSPVVPSPTKKVTCRKHFRKLKRNGKVRCVRVHRSHRKHHRGHHHKRRHGHH